MSDHFGQKLLKKINQYNITDTIIIEPKTLEVNVEFVITRTGQK